MNKLTDRLIDLDNGDADIMARIIEAEETFMDRLAMVLARLVDDGAVDNDYADYLLHRPDEAAQWLLDYHGIKV